MENDNPNMEAAAASRASEQEELLRQSISTAIAAGGGIKKMVYETGIPKGTLEKYLARTSTPSFLNAARIASSLGVSLDTLAGLKRPIFGDSADESLVISLPTASDSSPNRERLAAAIEAVEAGLGGRPIPPTIKAELTIAAYHLLTEVTAENRTRVMRLVKGG